MNGAFNYAEAFTEAYNAAVGNTIATALQTLGVQAPVAPAAPLPQDVQPEPVFREEPLPSSPPIEGDLRVLYGNTILPFGLEPVDYDTLLAMGGDLQFRQDISRVPVTTLVEQPAESVLVVDPLGNIVPPGTPIFPSAPPQWPPLDAPPLTLPPVPELPELPTERPPDPAPFLPPLPIGVAPISTAGLPFVSEEEPMSLIAAANVARTAITAFGRSPIGQSLITAGTTALANRLMAGRPMTQLPALPGSGFTSGRGFGGAPGKFEDFPGGPRGYRLTARGFVKRRRTNPMNVHALRRALRRVEGFVKLEKRVDKIVRRLRPARMQRTAARSGFVKRARR